MSILSGNDSTSLWTDLGSLFHNATTGELTDAQKAEIAQGATQEYVPCQSDPLSAACVSMTQGNLNVINTLNPDSGCVLSVVPGLPCFKSWNSVLFAVALTIGGVLALYGLLINYPVVAAIKQK